MMTAHVEGTMIGRTFHNSYYDVKSFDFDGQDDVKIDRLVKDAYYNMKKKGFVNVCIVTEDSLVPEDSAMPHLRWGKPYMLIGSGYPTAFVADMSLDEIENCWQ